MNISLDENSSVEVLKNMVYGKKTKLQMEGFSIVYHDHINRTKTSLTEYSGGKYIFNNESNRRTFLNLIKTHSEQFRNIMDSLRKSHEGPSVKEQISFAIGNV
jgi:YHS domain-containing protein